MMKLIFLIMNQSLLVGSKIMLWSGLEVTLPENLKTVKILLWVLQRFLMKKILLNLSGLISGILVAFFTQQMILKKILKFGKKNFINFTSMLLMDWAENQALLKIYFPSLKANSLIMILKYLNVLFDVEHSSEWNLFEDLLTLKLNQQDLRQRTS